MNVREYRKEDYPELARWWGAHKDWEAIPEVFLPETGIIVESEIGEPRAAGFIYKDGTSPVVMMEWIVANPDNSPLISLKSLNLLLTEMERIADDNGYVLFTTLRQPSLSRLYEKHGFEVGDTGMTNMMRAGKWA